MYKVDVYLRVRRAVMVEGMSMREAGRVFGLHRDTVRKMLAYSVPPGYRRQSPPRKPKLEPYTGVIDRILEDDLRRPRKQRHTAKRIFERLRDEYGFDGGYTTVKDYVRENRRQTKEMFVPLSHAPGHAQCDFGEALVVIGGVERKAHCLVIDLPHSDGCFVKAYPAETTEAFLDGHVSAFAYLGGVPQSILYDNTRLAVAKILGDGRRQRTRAFTELQSHYLFEDRFGRPGKGNDKGKVEGLVGYVRRNFLVPVPSFESFDALNAYLERRCLERMDAQLRGHTETIGQRMERDLDALLPLPPVAYDACEKQAGRVSSLSLVRYKTNDYSVPVAYGYRDVLILGYVDEVVISCGTEVIARLPTGWTVQPGLDLTSFTSPDGRLSMEIGRHLVQHDSSLGGFTDEYRQELLKQAPGWDHFTEKSARGGFIPAGHAVITTFDRRKTAADCTEDGITHLLRSRFFPKRSMGYSVTVTLCQEDLQKWKEIRSQMMESFTEKLTEE